MRFESNDIHDNRYTSNGYSIYLKADSWRNGRSGTVEFINNDIRDNAEGAAAVHFRDHTTYPVNVARKIIFSGNRVLGNRLTDIRKGVVSMYGYSFTYQYNFFVNPEMLNEMGSTLRCTTSCSGTCVSQCNGDISADNNWWGGSNSSYVESRLDDAIDDLQLPRISYEPQLNSSTFDCAEVNDCSGHGECGRPQTCLCFSGYTGSNCSEPTCEDVFSCNIGSNGGACVGPNTCNCTSQWEPPYCRTPICTQSCYRGVCARPDECLCLQGWSGALCNECADGFAGDECNLLCPNCGENGQCDAGRNGTGQCICDDRFAGATCRDCEAGLFGSDCLNLTATDFLVPNSGSDEGGNQVSLRGFHFENGSRYQARWGSGSFASRARDCEYVAVDRLLCEVPPSPNGAVDLTTIPVTVYENGQVVVYGSTLYYQYQAECPDSACVFGSCSRRQCQCWFGWTGDNCSTAIVGPRLEAVSALLAEEKEAFLASPFAVTQGTAPLTWSLSGAPSGLRIGSGSAQLTWDLPVARSQPYTFTIRVRNSVSEDSKVASLHVPLSYNTSVGLVSGNGVDITGPPRELVLPAQSYIQLRGAIQALQRDLSLAAQSVRLWLYSPTRSDVVVNVNTIITGDFQHYWTFSQ